jgi:hypothetical protein
MTEAFHLQPGDLQACRIVVRDEHTTGSRHLLCERKPVTRDEWSGRRRAARLPRLRVRRRKVAQHRADAFLQLAASKRPWEVCGEAGVARRECVAADA